MPGTLTFKPIEAKLTNKASLLPTITASPYCTFAVGSTKIETQPSQNIGKHPQWNDTIIVPILPDESPKVSVMLKDHSNDICAGSFDFDSAEVLVSGHTSKWYPLYDQEKYAGEILLETSYQPDVFNMYFAHLGHGHITATKPEEPKAVVIVKEEIKPESLTSVTPVVFTEQQKIVEPHTFKKQVESVEIRAHTQQIEVMEPIKVLKEVPVTETVHVKKLVEVTKPQVVIKEVEVMEQRLVTKTIQVVEDVPVKRNVEVIEYTTTMEEIETTEPQTVMKMVEVTEYVPVKKNVKVTEPVTVKREVEYVEPVTVTKTVTKEILQPVIVGEVLTCSVGPATILGVREGEVKESKIMIEEVRKSEGEVMTKEKVVVEKVVDTTTVIDEMTGEIIKVKAVGIEKI